MPDINDLKNIKPDLSNLKNINLIEKVLQPFTALMRDKAVGMVLARDNAKAAPLPPEKLLSVEALRPEARRFHGLKASLLWYPWWRWRTPCSDKYGYLTPATIRNATRLPFDAATQALLASLGDFMADTSRGAGADSTVPAGFTYFGQFVDHDITLDISSQLDVLQDATTINNMRSPAVDLDSLYGQGPAVDAFLYRFPTSGPATAIKMALGSNQPSGNGGPGGPAGFGGVTVQTTFDVPRVGNPLNPSLSTNTAIIADPRNDENLIVSQFHHAMLKVHNRVVDGLVSNAFAGDIFVQAKKVVTHHYQWVVVNDFLVKICGQAAVTAALSTVSAPVGSPFSMPVEFAVAAYRYGHSMIRDRYWLSFVQTSASLGDVFQFIKNPLVPVLSNWVIDFNAFFQTGIPVPVFNNAKKIDSVLAPGLDTLPGFTGLLAMLATRNLHRGLALGLPSGQGVAQHYGITPMTAAQLKTGLPAGEVTLLDSAGGILLTKTPLWYYVLREAMVLQNGNQLGPVGARIVAETFVRMLKRDADSYLNAPGGFSPSLNPATPGAFTAADLISLSGVNVP